jgi:dTMP kinase
MSGTSSPQIRFSGEPFPGILVTFCGLDGSGKTTQIQRLRAWAEGMGKTCTLTKQPTDETRKSYLFDRYIHHPNGAQEVEYRALSLLTMSDRVQHSLRFIKPALMRGEVVISDRYFFSAVANLRARGYVEDRWIYELATWLPRPDLAVFLDVPLDVALARIRARHHEANSYIDEEFEGRLNAEFVDVAAASPGGLLVNTVEHDADAVFARVIERFAPILTQKSRASAAEVAAASPGATRGDR